MEYCRTIKNSAEEKIMVRKCKMKKQIYSSMYNIIPLNGVYECVCTHACIEIKVVIFEYRG